MWKELLQMRKLIIKSASPLVFVLSLLSYYRIPKSELNKANNKIAELKAKLVQVNTKPVPLKKAE